MELGAEEVHAIAEWRLVGPGRIVGYSDIGPIRPSRRRVWAWLYTLPRFWAFRVNLTHSFQLPSGPLTDQHRLVELAGAQCRRSTLFVRPQRRTNAHLVQRAGDSKGAGSKRILRHEAYRVFWLSLNIRRAAANIDRAAHHVQGGIAPRYGNLGDHQTAQVLATAATGLRRLFLWFCFSRRSPETRCRCCRGRPPVLLRVLVGSVAVARRASQDGGMAPRQHSVTALALAERRPAQLPFWTQAEGAWPSATGGRAFLSSVSESR